MDEDEDMKSMMVIPLLWATKMMKANSEFLMEMKELGAFNDPKLMV